MKSPLHILHLEDDPNDAELVKSTLDTEGIPCLISCVQTRADFLAALGTGTIDLVLSDFSLPAFDGFSAIDIVRAEWPTIPLILVSGTLGEELAIDSLQRGATDYVLKQRLSRLVPALRRAMQEVEAREERQRLEAHFIEAQKMEVIGQLAGGVAHDFNNILAVIMGYSEVLDLELSAESPLRKYTEEIRNASELGAGLTRQLLVFSSKQAVQSVVLDLNEAIRDLDKILRRLIHENIEMTLIPGQIGLVKADSGYVAQLLMNLAVNARDAMPNGGKLTIATSTSRLPEAYARTHPGWPVGDCVMLSVRDTGTGMSDEVKEHLFEAFFTTKPKGKGTGLGLATCQTIVKQCGAYMDVESEIGQGTIFKIYFPRVRPSLEACALRQVQNRPVPGGTETLLVVEDEPTVRRLAQRILESQGYVVLSAGNGQEALQVAREHKGSPIGLVVTDVIMPVMGGPAMAAWLKTADPDLKVLFTSGYTDGAMAQPGVLEAGGDFLSKPYTPTTLARKVRELLDRPKALLCH